VSRMQRSARSITVRKAMYEGLSVKIVLRALSPLRPFARIFFVSTYSHVSLHEEAGLHLWIWWRGEYGWIGGGMESLELVVDFREATPRAHAR
jgi:hypothetical protein